jgi:hypothetical protein
MRERCKSPYIKPFRTSGYTSDQRFQHLSCEYCFPSLVTFGSPLVSFLFCFFYSIMIYYSIEDIFFIIDSHLVRKRHREEGGEFPLLVSATMRLIYNIFSLCVFANIGTTTISSHLSTHNSHFICICNGKQYLSICYECFRFIILTNITTINIHI